MLEYFKSLFHQQDSGQSYGRAYIKYFRSWQVIIGYHGQIISLVYSRKSIPFKKNVSIHKLIYYMPVHTIKKAVWIQLEESYPIH